MKEEVILEKAKDGDLTCKIKKDGVIKYLYSKYAPRKSINLKDIDENRDCYIMLGLGLGYELRKLGELVSKNIYVIEANRFFYELVLHNEQLKECLINPRIKIIIGEEFKILNEMDVSRAQIINNTNITSLYSDFFCKVINYLKSSTYKKKVLFFNYHFIAADCISALEEIGYRVVIKENQTNLSDKQICDIILEVKPNYLFTINFCRRIAYFCDHFRLPYISWTCDTPNFNLYTDQVFYKSNHLFVFDNSVVKELKTKGVTNIHYLPLAVNPDRLERIVLNTAESEEYSTDVSFVGNTGMKNDYNLLSRYFDKGNSPQSV